MTRILGIETSCDETAVAVVRDGVFVESNIIASQTALHAHFGGVVPEHASRAHLRAILPTLEEALATAHTDWAELDAIAVTHGPGLAGALLVGVNVAKGLAFACRKPILGINHLEGHVYANWLETSAPASEPTFPLVALIVSGGHSDLVLSDAHGRYRRLGRTRDDAAGEAFDKVGRLLGLGFPGGPAIERAAARGDPRRFVFPRAWLEPDSWDFSFSGLKTAVRNQVRDLGVDPEHASPAERHEKLPLTDLAASFQAAVVDVLATKAARAAQQFGATRLALGGGVAANRSLLRRVEAIAQLPVLCPPPRLCTDNAAMIASAGYFRFLAGERADVRLDVAPGMPIG
ncbi:MAG: tRNA (adenosine(37)-N6)-threonylcarbamoyltransferase complex transferase subunit TsaD [Chloroflexi bacterium]|nr:tRNA (adenosine(37)-N6)-threonylcarbamoyltransferase complex transferase subunit TsaD [Chloroflexota bacterium]